VEYGDERDERCMTSLKNRADEQHRQDQKTDAGRGRKNDPRVPVSESEQIVAALKSRARLSGI